MSLKALNKKMILAAALATLTLLSKSSAIERMGGANGGGGDATEIGVDAIRANILKWIETGRSVRLKQYPAGVNNAIYVQRMSIVLAPHAVVVSFVTTAQEATTTDPEQKVKVNGNAKSCRGFISVRDKRPHILCNVERYPKTGDEQYKLVHHEFAGLAGVEKNVGPSSDYTISKQITDNLISKTYRALPINQEEDAVAEKENGEIPTEGGHDPIGRSIDCRGPSLRANFIFTLSNPDGMNLSKGFIQDGKTPIPGPFITNEYFNNVSDSEPGRFNPSMGYPNQFMAFSYGALYRLVLSTLKPGKNIDATLTIEKNPDAGGPKFTVKKLKCDIADFAG
jgi:hypothetical protein